MLRVLKAFVLDFLVCVLIVGALACSSAPPAVAAGAPDADAGATPDTPATACAPAAPASPIDVMTDRGTIRGELRDGVRVFQGVPFARPPVGALRWRRPEPAECWSDVKKTVAYGESCTQVDQRGNVVGSEDCLTLNIWTAAAAPGEKLPVFVWIHGGDNVIGSAFEEYAGEPVYGGAALAREERAVVVVIQYRLGPFGFLQHAALADDRGIQGNFGTLDQIAALDWVQRNVAAFGGDPSRVTIFGQSAGADAICALVASPLARDLFSRAIMHSGACHTNDRSVREITAKAALQRLGCTSGDIAACLRGKSTQEVARVPGGALSDTGGDYYITVDGVVLPQTPLAIFREGKQNRVPMIVMATRDEYLSLAPLVVQRRLASQADFEAYVREAFAPADADYIIEAYPTASYPSPERAFISALSDTVYHCANRRILRALVGSQSEPVYRAIFASVYDDPRLAPLGAGHGTDVPYVFSTFGEVKTSPAERALSAAMMEAWGRFAREGIPPTTILPFAPYDPAVDDYLLLDDVSTTERGLKTTLCDGWDRVATD